MHYSHFSFILLFYPVCGMVHIESERVAHVAAAGFLSRYLNGPFQYVRCHITFLPYKISLALNQKEGRKEMYFIYDHMEIV